MRLYPTQKNTLEFDPTMRSQQETVQEVTDAVITVYSNHKPFSKADCSVVLKFKETPAAGHTDGPKAIETSSRDINGGIGIGIKS